MVLPLPLPSSIPLLFSRLFILHRQMPQHHNGGGSLFHSNNFLFGFILGVLCSALIFLSQFVDIQFRLPSSSSTIFLSEIGQKSNFAYEGVAGQNASSSSFSRRPRIFCWILTTHYYHRERADHIEATWAKRCDQHLFMSSGEDGRLPAVNLSVNEGRQFLWAKTKAAFKYIYNNVNISEFDWFLKADDDTFVVVENARLLLAPYSPASLLYFGCIFHFMDISLNQTYPSGGAGYILSRAALAKFVEVGLGGDAICDSSEIYEDLEIGSCMRKLNVTPGDSRDSLGRHRFIPLSPDRSLMPLPGNHVDTWVRSYSQFPYEPGPNCCSDSVVSFHYISPQMMHALDFLIYRLKLNGHAKWKEENGGGRGGEVDIETALANIGPNDREWIGAGNEGKMEANETRKTE